MNQETIDSLENNYIAPKTKQRYSCCNYNFILWLYEHRTTISNVLRESIILQISQAEADTSDLRQRNKNIRKIIMTSFEQMIRNRPDLFPVDVSQLSYEIIASYLTSRKNNEGQYLSKTSYSGIRSSIVYLFTMSNSQPPALFRERMQTLLKGLKRTIIAHAVNTGTSLEEGKDAMSFACYSLLCKKFFEGEKAEYIFAHLFLTLEWNLIARSDNVVNLSVRDLEWRDDSLIVYFKKIENGSRGC